MASGDRVHSLCKRTVSFEIGDALGTHSLIHVAVFYRSAAYSAVRANIHLTPIFALITDCGGTLAAIAFFSMINVVKGFVAEDALVDARGSIDLIACQPWTNSFG